MTPNTLRAAVLAALIPAFAAGCSTSTSAATPPPASITAATASARAMPDFTRLVAEEGPAVVNISVTSEASAQAVPFDGNDPMSGFPPASVPGSSTAFTGCRGLTAKEAASALRS